MFRFRVEFFVLMLPLLLSILYFMTLLFGHTCLYRTVFYIYVLRCLSPSLPRTLFASFGLSSSVMFEYLPDIERASIRQIPTT